MKKFPFTPVSLILAVLLVSALSGCKLTGVDQATLEEADTTTLSDREDAGIDQVIVEDKGEGNYVNPNYDEKVDNETAEEGEDDTTSIDNTPTSVDQAHLSDPEL